MSNAMKGNGETIISIISYRFNYNTVIEKSPPFPICNEKMNYTSIVQGMQINI